MNLMYILLAMALLANGKGAKALPAASSVSERGERQLTLTDYVHVHNPNPGANSFDWLPGNSHIQTPSIPVLPPAPSTPFLGK